MSSAMPLPLFSFTSSSVTPGNWNKGDAPGRSAWEKEALRCITSSVGVSQLWLSDMERRELRRTGRCRRRSFCTGGGNKEY